jgi:hypothetical protein
VRISQPKHLSAAHVIFLLAVHTIETMRAACGLPSSLVWNFSNANLSEHPVLGHYLVALSERVLPQFYKEFLILNINTDYARLDRGDEPTSSRSLTPGITVRGAAKSTDLWLSPHRESASVSINIP